MNDTILFAIGSGLVSILLGGNVYFVKRLIEKIEATAKSATEASFSASNAAVSAQNASSELKDIKSEIKELRRLEIDVAILKSHLGLKARPPDQEGHF